MKYIYRFARYRQFAQREFENLDDALRAAFVDFDSGEVWIKDIIDEKGNIILDHKALLEKFSEWKK
jgi:hypothetical protein